eukprot:scaffold655_cov225-Pinguiococcus_pyrenoidosus.AAC.23
MDATDFDSTDMSTERALQAASQSRLKFGGLFHLDFAVTTASWEQCTRWQINGSALAYTPLR